MQRWIYLQCVTGGSFAGSDHALDTRVAGPIACPWNMWMDQEIRMPQRIPVVDRIQPMRFGMRRRQADTAKNRTDFPHVRPNDEVGAHLTADLGRKDASDPTVFQRLAIPPNSSANHAHCATGIDRRSQMAACDRNGMFPGE